jgi:hypothetical protein
MLGNCFVFSFQCFEQLLKSLIQKTLEIIFPSSSYPVVKLTFPLSVIGTIVKPSSNPQ